VLHIAEESFFPLHLEVNAGAWAALGFCYRVANKSKILIANVGCFDTEDVSKALCSSRLIHYCKTPWMLGVYIFGSVGFVHITTDVPGANW